jgi:hypothetical protein
MVRAYRKLKTNDADLNKVQDNIALTLRPVLQCPLLGGVQVSEVQVGTTPTPISHTLGQVPQGWYLVDLNANAQVWSTAKDSRTLTLQATSACTVSLWVY